jgi:tetratricopeptide (TPR) repeat protein
VLGLFLIGCLVGSCGPDRVDQANALGREAFSQGDDTQALAHFDEALALDPDNAAAYLGRGMVYWRKSQHAQAVPELDRALALDPDLIWAYYFRGASLISLHRYDAGVEDFAVVTASDTLAAEDLLRAHRWRGIALLNLERYEESLIDFTQCIVLQPDEPFHYVERGRVYEAIGQTEKAIADYERFLALNEAENAVAAEVRARLSALASTSVE